MNLQSIAYLLVSCISTVIILIYGQSILVPFILGLLLWFIGHELKKVLNKISFIRNYFPNWLKTIIPVTIILILLVMVTRILSSNINQLANSFESYEPNIDSLLSKLDQLLNMDVKEALKGYTANFKFGTLLRSLLASLSELIGNSFMVILYALFVLLEEANFKPKLQAIFSGENQNKRIDELLGRVGDSISSYFRLKTLLSLITGVLSYIALWFIGVDAPEFWAFLIFILNFIPTIGSLVATIFPALFCLFQFGAFLPSILVVLIVGAIQLLVGNLLEPKIMGSSMNISPVVTILTLSLWGAIWGITGMILSVPITVVMIIIFSQFEKTKPISILLSEKGDIS